MKRLGWLVLLLVVSCAHAPKVQPIVITGHVLDAGGMTFEAVLAGMSAACPSVERCRLTREQALAWNDFSARWDAGYRAAAKAWKDARAKLDEPAAQQAAALLGSLLGELATWQFVVQGASP